MPQVSVIPRTHPEVLDFLKEAFTYARSQVFFQRRLYRKNQNENWVQTRGCVFSLLSTLSDLIRWGKGLFVSLKQANWFHLAHGAKEAREVRDKDFWCEGDWVGLSHSRQQTQDTDPCLPFPLLLPHNSILNTLQMFWGMGWFYVCYCNLHSAWHKRAQILINTGAPRVDVQDFLLWHGDCQTESATCFFDC